MFQSIHLHLVGRRSNISFAQRFFYSFTSPAPRFYLSDADMARSMSVTFLGTSSGGGPSESRNCSSLICDVLGNGALWMVDCAEGTLRQFSLQPRGRPFLKVNRLSKIFITHMHADHIMGIVPILRNTLHPPAADAPTEGSTAPQVPREPPKIEIYGPAGIRSFLRTILKLTLTRTSDNYVVHELLNPLDPITPCDPEILHANECPGRDILSSPDNGFWKSIAQSKGIFGHVIVDAGPISHRDPCIGYVIHEPSESGRKLVILGDTYDPSAITPLCTSASLLIHEATDAYIPQSVDPQARRSLEVVQAKTLLRGHSTPTMAGEFANKIGAKKLVLNHIGGRFPASRNGNDSRAAVIREIERQATAAWGMGEARAAWDFMNVVIPAPGAVVTPAAQHSHRPTSSNQMTSHRMFHTDSAEVPPNSEHQRKRRR
ncbi:beta-lactamase-like protein [Infundibulicybe gibba]|nr:beta-lactamase-like protein [Infundibulicybe gibba]